jgi:hypothetical protein
MSIIIGYGIMYYLKKDSTTKSQRLMKRFMKIIAIIVMLLFSIMLYSDSVGFYKKCKICDNTIVLKIDEMLEGKKVNCTKCKFSKKLATKKVN